MAISDKLIKIVESKGWPAIASMFFDNGLGVEVFNSRGYVAINPNDGLVYSTSIIDITDTSKMEGQVVIMPEKKIYNQQTIAVYDLECLQSFELAHYSYWDYIPDEGDKMPMPKIPTKDEIMAYKLAADDKMGSLYDETGTYRQFHKFDGADMSELRQLGETESVISMFDDQTNRASLVIGWWQMFFNNQEKFKKAIQETYGDTGLI